MADPTSQQTRKITINVDAGQTGPQLKAISDQLGVLNTNTKGLADSFNFISSSASKFLATIGVGFGLKQLAEFSDQIQTLQNRLIAVTGSQEEANILMGDLAQTARDTNSSLQATADVYARVSLALKDANISTQTTLEFTKTLVDTFRLSGASADQAATSVTSLAYGFQLGEIRGRELRTVLRENTVLAQLLKKEFDGNLLSAANDGFITTSKLMEIVLKNMDSIQQRASQLSSTFSQTAVKGLDAFKLKIFEVNEALGLSGGFASIMDTVIKNMGTFVTIGTILVVSTLPQMVSQVLKLGTALLSLAPGAAILTGGLAVGLAAVVALFGDSSDIGDLINQLKIGFSELKAGILDVFSTITTTISNFKLVPAQVALDMGNLGKATAQAAQDAHVHAEALRIEYDASKALGDLQKKNADEAARRAQDIASVRDKVRPDLTPQQLLADLNKEFRTGAVDIDEYNQKLQEVSVQSASKNFRDGKEDLEKFNQATDNFKIFNLNEELKNGIITLSQFDTAVRNVQLNALNRQLDEGKISLEDYNLKLAAVSDKFSSNGAFRTGLQSYLTSIGTTTQQVAAGITQAFKNVEDSFVSFIKTGKFNFDKFTQDILDDLLRIIVRASIIAPIAQGVLGALPLNATPTYQTSSTSGASGLDTLNAHGGVFNRDVMKYASGGVISAPTIFGYGQGKVGLMGEAGPEAIVPLKRGSGGDLGVKASLTPVTINIINQSGNEVQQQETTGPNGDKQIDVLITGKVANALGSGKLDKIMKSSFGITRKGT